MEGIPVSDTAAVHAAAQRHAYASLVRTDGWRLYMEHLLKRLDILKRLRRNPENTDHMRSFYIGCEQQIEEAMAFPYKEADEEGPIESERKALLMRLAGMPYKTIPEEQAKQQEQEDKPPVRRSRRAYAGGVE